ncbi:YdbH domain-containing protein [Neptunomonas sp.]|uniref:YdbH domain-containing protein n=1 Tax=Neptunomonas sp. TaxID=1971898 RepID=UPI0025F55720|nr:YdbH domain-containing protein [Neptunomonas sp.]
MKRWLTLSLSILLLLPLIGYVSMPFIAKSIVENWLLEQGFYKPIFSVEYPSHRELLISHISVEKHTDNRISTLTAGPVSIKYDPWALLFKGELSRIEIPSAALDIAMTGKAEKEEIQDAPASFDLSLLLPDQWLGFSPANELVIGQLDVKWHGPDQPLYRFTGNIFLTQQILLSRVFTSIGNKELTHSDITVLRDNRFRINIIDRATSSLNPIVRLLGQLSSKKDTINLQSLHSIDIGKVQEIAQQLSLNKIDTLPLMGGSYSGENNLSFARKYEGGIEQWLTSIRVQQNSQLNAWVQKPAKDINIDSLYLSLPSSFEYTYPDTLKLNISKESTFSIFKFEQEEWSIAKTNISLNDDFILHNSGTTSIQPFSATITPQTIRNPEIQITSQPITFAFSDIDVAQLKTTLSFQTNNIQLKQKNQKIPSVSIAGNLYIHFPNIKAGFSIESADIPLNTAISINMNLDKELINAQWRIKEILLADNPSQWQAYLPFEWPQALTLTRGNYTQAGNLQWSSGRLDGTINHSLNDTHLTHENAKVIGLSINSQTHLRGKRVDEQGSLQVNQVDAGVYVNNIKAQFRLNKLDSANPVADITHVSGSLLNGTFQLAPFHSPLNPPTINTDLYLRGLSLNALLQLEQQPGLTGEGVLDGDLPLSFNKSGLSVSDGNVSAREAGVIRYQPDASIQTLRESYLGLGIALDALSNFHFKKLSIGADYSANGALLLKTQLKGSNPEWNNGQQVNFSMNIEENLHKLMKTLQFTDELTNRIEKRYRTP